MSIRNLFQGNPIIKPECYFAATFQVCATGKRFVGCCFSNDTCDNSCSALGIDYAKFDPNALGKFHDQQCSDGIK